MVDSNKFPISKTITGAPSLDLDLGRSLRELHWHPTADEWQYTFLKEHR